MRSIVSAVAVALLVSACSGIPGSEQAITGVAQQRIESNDNKARLLKLSICDMSVGAYHRALTQAERDAVTILCGGQRAVTAQDVLTLRKLVEALRKVE